MAAADNNDKSRERINPNSVRKKMHKVASKMRKYCIDQTDMIEALLLAVVSGQHVLFVGPWGTNKTRAIDIFTHLIGADRDSIFRIMLDKSTPPDALLGPYSPKSVIEDGIFRRNIDPTEGRTIVNSTFAFVGEVFSGNSATRRALHSTMNERYIDNGGERIPVRVRNVFCDTNELPIAREDQPFFDRIALRVPVKYLSHTNRKNFSAMMKQTPFDFNRPGILTPRETLRACRFAQRITIPDLIYEELFGLRSGLASDGKYEIAFSDRRWWICNCILQAAAWLRGASTVEPCDLWSLRHVLWTRLEQRPPVYDRLQSYKGMSIEKMERDLYEDALNVFDVAINSGDSTRIEHATTHLTKLKAQVVTQETADSISECLSKLKGEALKTDGDTNSNRLDLPPNEPVSIAETNDTGETAETWWETHSPQNDEYKE